MALNLLLNAGTLTWYVSGDQVKAINDDHFIILRSSDYFA